jgi:hypothetical protein
MVRAGVRVFLSLMIAGGAAFPPVAAGEQEGDLSVRVARPLVFEIPASGRWCVPAGQQPGGRVDVFGAPWHPVHLVAHGRTIVGIDDENWGETIALETIYGPGDFLMPDSGVQSVVIGGCVRATEHHTPGRYRYSGNFSAFYE